MRKNSSNYIYFITILFLFYFIFISQNIDIIPFIYSREHNKSNNDLNGLRTTKSDVTISFTHDG